MRRAARVDRNHGEIVAALRSMGCTVTSLAAIGGGCPDLIVGVNGVNLLIEVKDGTKPASARKLTPDQIEWHADWNGQVTVVYSVNDAIALVESTKKAGSKTPAVVHI